MEIRPNEEFIASNYDKTMQFIDKIFTGQQKENILSFFKEFSDRYAICPASTQKEFYSAFPGGLCYHNLNVLKYCVKLNNELCGGKYTKDTLFLVSLFHEIGKIGDKEQEYYVSSDSDWKRDKGIYYDINDKIDFMSIEHRSLYLLNNFKIHLTRDEFLAILLHQGHTNEANKSYKYKESEFAALFYMADQWAIKQEKQNTIILA